MSLLINVPRVSHNLRRVERQRRSNRQILDCTQHENPVLPRQIEIVVDWLWEVNGHFKFNKDVFFTAVDVLHNFVTRTSIQINMLQCAGIVAMLLAEKFHTGYDTFFDVSDAVYMCDGGCTAQQIRDMEFAILNSLRFNIAQPSPYRFAMALVDMHFKDATDDHRKEVEYWLFNAAMQYRMYTAVNNSTIGAAAVWIMLKRLDETAQPEFYEDELLPVAQHMAAYNAPGFKSWLKQSTAYPHPPEFGGVPVPALWKNNSPICSAIEFVVAASVAPVWEKYTKGDRLGKGSFGDVYLGKDADGRNVAVKLINENMVDGDGTIEWDQLREVALQMLLPKPHTSVVELLEASTTPDNAICLVYEYLGKDLGAWLHVNGRLSTGQAKPIITQITKGIDFLHSYGFIHGDLKPANILIQGDIVKVADLGMSVYAPIVPGAKFSGDCTFWYSAPESLLDGQFRSQPVDAWAIGCITAELLRGVALFPEDSEALMLKAMSKIIRAQPPAAVVELLAKANGIPTKTPDDTTLASAMHMDDVLTESQAQALDFVSKLIDWNPETRLNAESALSHPFINESPSVPVTLERQVISKLVKGTPKAGIWNGRLRARRN